MNAAIVILAGTESHTDTGRLVNGLEAAERLEANIDDAELVALDDTTHWVMEDRPEAYRERLAEFLLA